MPQLTLPFIEEVEEVVAFDPTKEICICAAVVDNTGKVIRGHRHDDCFKRIISMKNKPESAQWAQGFITSYDRYVTREEGRILQDEAGIKSVDPGGYMGDTLFSEDLY